MLRLLHLLEETLQIYPKLADLLERIIDGPPMLAAALVDVDAPKAYRNPPVGTETQEKFDI